MSQVDPLRTFEVRAFDSVVMVLCRPDRVFERAVSMAAATGEVEWIERYRSFEPKLDAAIKQAIDIAQRPDIADAIRDSDAANYELVKMENQAFALVRARRPEDTRSIL